ncbi:hypothetical protein ACTFIW_009545 [Dictyostelium discoideum]
MILKEENNGIGIIGIGFRLPGGGGGGSGKSLGNPGELWKELVNGYDGIIETNERWSDNFNKLGEINNKYGGLLPMDEVKSFDPLFFGISPPEATAIDPQQRLLLKCTWEAVEDAMIDPINLRGSNTSVFIGNSTHEYRDLNRTIDSIQTNIFSSSSHSSSNRVSNIFDFHGPSITIDTACSSSSNAVVLGCESIIEGNSKMSIVGGTSLILDTNTPKSFSYMNMLSKDGRCKSFDANADGYVRSECIGVLLLKDLNQAIIDGDRVYCVIKGTSSNVDGNGYSDKSNFYSPSAQSQAENIKMALSSGNINAKDVDYVEAHGTGTPIGDPIEVEGISSIFKDNHSKDNPLLIGSFKSMIGHCEASSGIASLVKCCLMFKNRYFIPNLHFKTPNPLIKFNEWNLKVVVEPTPFPKKEITMAVNNFGVTGSNVCIILKDYNHTSSSDNNDTISLKQKQQQHQNNIEYLIPFSANSTKSLEQYQSLISNFNQETMEFNDFVKEQIMSKSNSLYQRSVILGSNWNDFKDNLISTNSNNNIKTIKTTSSNISIKSKNPIIIMVFCGQGSQYNTMALELYKNEPIFRNTMDMLDNKLSKYYGFSILEKLRSISVDDMKSIHNPALAQPAICMVQISLFELYKHWGIKPTFIVGHSLGDVTAAYCSGMIDLETECYLIYHRSIAQSTTTGCGRMLSINISPEKFIEQFSSRYPDVEISCYNSPTSIVIGGKEDQLNKISEELKSKGEFTSMLGSLSSFHTSSQKAIEEYILSLDYKSKESEIPIFSTVTTDLFDYKTTPYSPKYTFENILKPVYFTQTIENLYKHIETNQLGTDIVFIELAPHPTLQFYLKQMIPKDSSYFGKGDSISIYSPLHKKKNDVKEIRQTISQLYCQNGYNVNFKCQFENINRSIVPTHKLPLYQWDEKQFWKINSLYENYYLTGPPIDILGNSITDSPFVKSYQTFINIKREPFQYLKGHVVKGKYYFPGCGYIDNLLKLYPSQDITISTLEFSTPLIFTDDLVNHCLQTNIYPTGKTEYKVLFHFKDQKKNEWIQSSFGNFQLFKHHGEKSLKIFNQKYNIKDLIEKRCNFTKLNKEDLYDHIKLKTGLTYSGSFQAVSMCYLGGNCSLSVVSLELPKHLPDQKSFFNSSILDCCLHGMIGLVDEHCQLVFDRIEGFNLYSSNIPSARDQHTNVYVYSSLNAKMGDSYFASIVVMLEDGTVLIEIDNAVCTSLTPIQDSLKIEAPTNELYSTYLQSKDSLILPPQTFKSLYKQQEKEQNDNLVGTIIKQSLVPFVNEKMVFRILDFSSGLADYNGTTFQSSNNILETFNQLLKEFPLCEIDIEYTFGSVPQSLTSSIKDKLSHINERVSILYRDYSINDPLLLEDNQLKPSQYDIVLINDLEKETSDIKATLYMIYNLIVPNGQLILINNDGNNFIEIIELLYQCSFKDTIISKDKKSIIQTRKPKLLSGLSPNPNIDSYDQIIIYGNDDSEICNKFLKSLESTDDKILNIISTISKFNEFVEKQSITDKSVIYFIKTMEQLTLDNFKSVTFEYIEINRKLLKLNSMCKHVLITSDSRKDNYLASSVIGAARYFDEFQQLQLFTLDFDKESIIEYTHSKNNKNNNEKNLVSLIELLTDKKISIQKEYLIRNGKVYFERIKKEQNLRKKFKSESYQDLVENDLVAVLSPNLEYELKPMTKDLEPFEVQVEIKSFALNYKDYLTYIGSVPPEMVNHKTGDINDPEFGSDFSGVITRVSKNNCSEFKVGDQVYGTAYNTASSKSIIDSGSIYFKPNNLSHEQASTIPVVYSTSLHSIYNIGNLKNYESILIHSASGGVGLSSLNILKWKGHYSYIFLTVGSPEKEKYLRDTYGSLITGIYSTRDKSYVQKIKDKLKELGSDKTGVDLILNTLSSDYMDSNFNCLSKSGRIVDLSITHLNSNEYIDNKKFKFNYGYHNVELLFIPAPILKELLKSISKAIENNELINDLPITQYSNVDIKNAFEYINQRKHIGKIVVNHDTDLVGNLIKDKINSTSNLDYTLLKSNYQININNLGKNILVTGQSGIVFEIIKWVVKFAPFVENIIILSKSSMKWQLELLVNRNKHIKFHFKSVDVGDIISMGKAIDEVSNDIDNIDSIFHYAFHQITKNVEDISMDTLDISFGAKTIGAIILHDQSILRGWKLKNFIIASSVASSLGSESQCSYVCANNILESFSQYRKSLGLPSICTSYGLIKSTGFVSRNENVSVMFENLGFNPLSTNTILGSLDLQIQNQELSTNLIVSSFNFSNITKYNPQKNNFSKINYQVSLEEKNKVNQLSHDGNRDNKNSVNQMFLEKVSEVLSIEISKINTDIKPSAYGADSLSIVQLKNWVDKELSGNIITIQQLQTNTISSSIKIITNSLDKKKKEGKNKSSTVVNNTNEITSTKTIEYWKNEVKLDETIIASSIKSDLIIDNKMDKVILLSGSTGFLGGYLLLNLVKMKNCSKIYCLTRSNHLSDQTNLMNKIIENLKHHKLFEMFEQSELEKIFPVYGDLGKSKLGLSDKMYLEISNQVNLILSCGADINLNANYDEIKPTNVESTKEFIKLSVSKGTNKPMIPIVNLSSFSIFFGQKLNDGIEFDEYQVGIPSLSNLNNLPGGYMQSKLICEHLLLEASSRGIPAMTIRLPSIFSNPHTGVGHSGDLLQLIIKSIGVTKYFPIEPTSLFISPITWVAQNIINLIFNEGCWSKTKINTLNIISLNGELQTTNEIFQMIKKNFNYKETTLTNWKKMISESNDKTCIRLRTFHSLDFTPAKYHMSKEFNISKNTKSFLISFGSYDGWNITEQMILNLLKQ